jgi:hypothetical protein
MWDDGGVTSADFPPDPEPEPGVPEPERPPRRVRPARARGGTAKGKAPRKRPWDFLKAGPVKNRTSLSEFASDTWRDLAMITAPLPPLSRVLGIQAPYAGVVFDEAVKGTPVDALLQPVARYSQSIRALNGLIGPPVFTLDLCLNGNFNQDEETGRITGPADQHTTVALMGLRYSLVQMIRISNVNAEAIAARAEEDALMDRQVDRLISLILTGVAPQAPPSPAAPPPAPDGEVIHPTQVYVYPQAPTMDDTGADPARM